MAIVTNNVNLETTKYNTVRVIVAKQNDSASRQLKAVFIGDGGKINIESGAVVTMTCKHATAGVHSITNGVANSDGTVTVTLDSWVMALTGDLECSITATINGAKLSTTSFFITVQGSDTLAYGILVYSATSALSAGTYYVTLGNTNYQFTTSSQVPAGGTIYFNSTLTTANTYNSSGTSVQSNISVTVGSSGTHLSSDIGDLITALTTLVTNHTANTSNPHNVTKAQLGLGNVDNKSEATIKSDFTGSVAAGNTGFVTGNDVYTALSGLLTFADDGQGNITITKSVATIAPASGVDF